jgi:hypothetical protein
MPLENATAATRVTFLLDSGETVIKTKVVPAHSRYTTAGGFRGSPSRRGDLRDDDQRHVGHRRRARDVLGSRRERLDRQSQRVRRHAPGTRWGFAEGRVGGPLDFHSYIQIGNPADSAADVKLTYLKTDGSTIVKTYQVAATSRFTVDMGATSGLKDESFGVIVEHERRRHHRRAGDVLDRRRCPLRRRLRHDRHAAAVARFALARSGRVRSRSDGRLEPLCVHEGTHPSGCWCAGLGRSSCG